MTGALKRLPDPATDLIIGRSGRRGSRALPGEFVEHDDTAAAQVIRQSCDRSRGVRNELQDVAAHNGVERLVEGHQLAADQNLRHVREDARHAAVSPAVQRS